ncbi:MAG TPA: adenylate/guanylate cyclase domain-containing protein [Actinomycetota bacterium]
MRRPDTRFTWSGDFSIAYQVTGSGAVDVLYLPAWFSNVEGNRLVPEIAHFLERLESFARVIVMDRRGVGCSDRLPPGEAATLEELVDDVLAVMAAAQTSRRTVIFGVEEGGFVAMLAAATHPDRFSGLILFGCAPGYRRTGELPWQWDEDMFASTIEQFRSATSLRELADAYVRDALPSIHDRTGSIEAVRSLMGLTQGIGAAMAEVWKMGEVDLLDLLPSIRVPTLVLHRTEDPVEPLASGRLLAERIPDAHLIELDGADALPWAGDADEVADEIEEFLTGSRGAQRADRRLATVLFTDMVGSTELASRLGDAAWHELLGKHHSAVRAELQRHRGVEVDTAGDGFFATFDGPARAVECARSIAETVRSLGVEVRAGVHTGEIEVARDEVRGISVHIGARVMALAGPSEVLVSSTVRDLVAGSGLRFEDAGEHELKGVPDRWRLYRVVDAERP